MKKLTLILAIVAACVCAFAQQTTANGNKTTDKSDKWHGTRIGRNYQTDYGISLGYGGGNLAWWGNFVFDVNAAHQNYRTRFEAGGVERWYWPVLSVEAQWLLPFCDGFYFFPSVGVQGELHNTTNWKNAFLANHPDATVDPDAKWGPGSWGMGINLGGGLEYQINHHIAVFAEGRYSLMYNTNSRWSCNVGVVMNFSQGRAATDNCKK